MHGKGIKREFEESNAAQARKRRIAEASRASRAKKKQEFQDLKRDNALLRMERETLKAKIVQLQAQCDNKLSTSTLNMIAENSALQLQLRQHQKFVDAFISLTNGTPSTKGAQVRLCKQGAEAAQSYVQGLISQSQKCWKRLKPPKHLAAALADIKIHYELVESRLFKGGNGANVDAGPTSRLNLRIDMSSSACKHKEMTDYFWHSLNSPESQKLLYGVETIHLEELHSPDDDTKLLYQTSKYKKSVVFMCNRQDCELVKSTLAPPAEVPGTSSSNDTTSKRKNVASFGKVKASVCAMTSTHSTLETVRTLGTDIPRDMRHITSIVIQGVLAYDDPITEEARLVVVLSYPAEYQIIDINHADCFQDQETMSETFARLLMGIFEKMKMDLLLKKKPAESPDEKKPSLFSCLV